MRGGLSCRFTLLESCAYHCVSQRSSSYELQRAVAQQNLGPPGLVLALVQVVSNILDKGRDLREFSREVEEKLRQVELESIQVRPCNTRFPSCVLRVHPGTPCNSHSRSHVPTWVVLRSDPHGQSVYIRHRAGVGGVP